MELSLKKLSDINRLLGVIEGAACVAPTDVARVIGDAVDAIDELLKEGVDDGQ